MNVTVYTLPACQPCRLTKMKLDNLGIPYRERPAQDADPQLGYTSAPIVEVDCGDGASWTWSGYRPSQLEQLAATL